MRAVLDLPARDFRGFFPLLFGDHVFEETRADDIGSLADDERTIAVLSLHQFFVRIVGSMRGRLYRPRPFSRSHLRDSFDVRRRSAATTAHQVQPAMIDELLKLRRERIRRFPELSIRVWKPGIGIAGNTEPGHFVQAANVIRHQIRTSGAIHAHCEEFVIRDGGIQRVNRLAAQHGAVALNGHRSDYGNRYAQIAAKLLHGQQRGLEASGVETSLDQQEIGATFDQPLGLLVIRIVQLREGDGRGDVQVLVGGAHGAGDETRLGWGGKLVGRLARDFGGGGVQFVSPIFQFVIGQRDACAAE